MAILATGSSSPSLTQETNLVAHRSEKMAVFQPPYQVRPSKTWTAMLSYVVILSSLP